MSAKKTTGVFKITTIRDGYSSAVVQLYRRYAPTQVAPTPALPTGALIYTFATGVLSGATASFNGWSQQIPAASADTKLFVTQATATSQDATDEISVNDWSTPVEYTKDGESALVADLTNEMDSVAMASNGKVLAQTVLTTTFNMYYGTALQTLTSLSPSGAAQGVTVSCNKLTRIVTITIAANTQLTDDKNVITLTGVCGQGTRSCEFTVSGVRGGSAGVTPTLFNIVPSVDTIKRDKNNTLTPVSITCSVQKITGDNVTTAAAGDGTLRYAVDGDITSSSDGTAMSLGGTVSYTANNHYITFAYFVGTTMRDKERVPIVYDGEKGDQGYGIMLTLTRSYNESQWESISGVGNQENFSYTGDVTLRAGDYFVVKGISTDAHLTHVVTFICTNQTAGIVYGTCVSAVCDGKQGPKGDTGRMFYLCGEWPKKAPYTRDAYRCPVVYYGGKYWYLDADSEDGTRAPGATGVTIWKEATSFDMVYTDVLFAKEFAMLGSFIVSGDWLISTKGMLGGAESQDYTKFDPAYPDTSVNTTHTVNGTTWTGYNFVPHYAVDGKEGDMYANKAKIKGAIEATSGRVNSLYIGEGVSDSEARIYMKADETTSGSQTKTPLIYGKDSSGNVVFRLGPAVDQPGGAAGTVFSGLAVGYAWISSGGFMVRNPNANQHYAAMAPGAIQLQYSLAGGGTAYARIETTGDGLKIYSQAWPSEGQVSSGCVYKDSNGYLRVKS